MSKLIDLVVTIIQTVYPLLVPLLVWTSILLFAFTLMIFAEHQIEQEKRNRICNALTDIQQDMERSGSANGQRWAAQIQRITLLLGGEHGE